MNIKDRIYLIRYLNQVTLEMWTVELKFKIKILRNPRSREALGVSVLLYHDSS